MTENTSPGMTSDSSKPATMMTREDWEREVAKEQEAQAKEEDNTSSDGSIGTTTVGGSPEPPTPADDIDARIEAALAKQQAQHDRELQATLARVPQLDVPAHSGGPGNDNHQVSWSLAEQEAAKRGETLEHWTT